MALLWLPGMRAAAVPLASERDGKPELQVVVFSDRSLNRDLMVDFLRRHGFPQADGRSPSQSAARVEAHAGPALAFVDLESDGTDSREWLRALRRQRPDLTMIAFGTPMQLAANAEEADGWLELTEPASRITKLAVAAARKRRGALRRRTSLAVERLTRTWQSLTHRQRQVLALLGCGLDNQKLAATLGLSERAVKAHVSALLDKFGADNRTELALIAARARVHSRAVDFPFR